jgi:hypothetical protein
MAQERPGFVNVDDLMGRISLEQAAAYYGIPLPALHRTGQETRTRCFLSCGREGETGDRALAVQEGHPAKQWRCHHYGCGKGGNLVSLCDLLKGGADAGGRPRGDRFKEIAADLRAMVEGIVTSPGRATVPASKPAPPAPFRSNVPLRDSENERARALVELDAKFVRDVADMPPAASRYFRLRPYLTPETCREWRVGYLPRDTGGDHAGGTMRGKVVYAYHSAEGDLLTWFGRDPEYEEKRQRWDAGGRTDREPEKFHFVKGFHRGAELFGQERLRDPEVPERTKGLGLVVVEGPNDVIRLRSLGVPAVGLGSNTISREQAAKAAALARSAAGGVVTVFLDCDVEGEKGMKQSLGYLAQLLPVRLAWTSRMFGGRFQGRQPESLTPEEWEEIASYLRTGEAKGWSLGE